MLALRWPPKVIFGMVSWQPPCEANNSSRYIWQWYIFMCNVCTLSRSSTPSSPCFIVISFAWNLNSIFLYKTNLSSPSYGSRVRERVGRGWLTSTYRAQIPSPHCPHACEAGSGPYYVEFDSVAIDLLQWKWFHSNRKLIGLITLTRTVMLRCRLIPMIKNLLQ